MSAIPKPPLQTATRQRPCSRAAAAAGLCLGIGIAPAWAQDSTTLQVRWGQTASAIALAHRPAGATLNQVLLAMLRNNPQAFVQDNVNLLRAGATLRIPSTEQVLALSPEQAHRAVRAQEAAFDALRRRTAGASPARAQGGPDRQASGPILDAQTPNQSTLNEEDRLSLSKAQGATDLEALTQDRQAQEDADRLKAIKRNLQALSQLDQADQPPGHTLAHENANKPANSSEASPAAEPTDPSPPTTGAVESGPQGAPATQAEVQAPKNENGVGTDQSASDKALFPDSAPPADAVTAQANADAGNDSAPTSSATAEEISVTAPGDPGPMSGAAPTDPGLIERWGRHPWLVPIGAVFLGGLLLLALLRSGRKGPVLPIGSAAAQPTVAADLPEEANGTEGELSESALRQEVERLNQHPQSGHAAHPVQSVAGPAPHQPLSFDLSSINLDLDSPPTAPAQAPGQTPGPQNPQRPS